MQNRNLTANQVEKEPSRILQELRDYAATHPVFARKMKEKGVEFTPEWLKKTASKRAFRGLHIWKSVIPQIAQATIAKRERSILKSYSELTRYIVEDT